MKIYILLAHPLSQSFNGQIADAYYQKAQQCGHEVRIQRLGEMDFDVVLRNGYQKIQALEPDLVQAQENILWCDKWVIVYPMWWGSMPALLKGFFDRVLLPKFAFQYHKDDPFWDKLLKGRSAELITTCDAPTWWVWWQYGNADIKAIKVATLEFCGFSPVKVTRIGRLRFLSEEERKTWIEKIVKKIK